MKAHRQTTKRTQHNRELRSKLRTALKTIRAAKPADRKAALSGTFSVIDKMAAKGLIHRNAASRYKSRLAQGTSKRSSSASS